MRALLLSALARAFVFGANNNQFERPGPTIASFTGMTLSLSIEK